MYRSQLSGLYMTDLHILQHRLREVLHRLSHAEVRQNLLSSTQNSIKLVRAVEHLDDPAHTSLGQSTSSEDVGGVVGDLVCGPSSMRLEETDGSAHVFSLLGITHVAHLVGDGFEPGLVGLGEGDHPGEPETEQLVSSDRGTDENGVAYF